jgi:hypothetical protein
MFDEKRKTIRISKPLAVQFGIRAGDVYSWDMSLIKDICESGICLRTGSLMGKNAHCRLRIRMPHRPSEVLDIDSNVVDSTESRTGIYVTRLRFSNLNEEQLQFLREYIAWALVQERGNK